MHWPGFFSLSLASGLLMTYEAQFPFTEDTKLNQDCHFRLQISKQVSNMIGTLEEDILTAGVPDYEAY